MRRGWFGQSYRHYLAAKGVRSSYGRAGVPMRYYAEAPSSKAADAASRTASFLKGMVADDRPEVENYQQKNRLQEIDARREKIREYLNKLADQGELDPKRAEDFFEQGGPFEDVSKDYLNGTYDRHRFQERLDGEVKRHVQVNRKVVSLGL